MKRIIIASILALIFSCSSVMARTIIVKISNVRGEKGNVLVMTRQGKESKIERSSAFERNRLNEK